MTVSLFSRKAVGCGFLSLALPVLVVAEANYVPQGTEYAVAGMIPGDQVWPAVAISSQGGYVVWQDNFTDGFGTGISARWLDSSLSGYFAPFQVNETAAGNQERPQVALLKNGGAVFVWQGGPAGRQNIFARFLSPAEGWLPAHEIRVNTYTNETRQNPAVACLDDGSVVVVWGSFGQETGTDVLQGVFAQRLSAAGQKLGGEFQVNITVPYNQRTPAVAALAGGGFAVAWVSEQQRNPNSVDVYVRMFNTGGSPTTGEVLVNTSTNVCASPRLAGAADGTFLVAWQERTARRSEESWDIWARTMNRTGVGGPVRRLNAHSYGDQYLPSVACSGSDYLVTWCSLGQDGSREGVYGCAVAGTGIPLGGEFRVNTTTLAAQMHPTLASDGAGHFLAVWTSFGGGLNSFDLAAQRYGAWQEPLVTPEAPFVTVLSSNRLAVSWPAMAGYEIAGYEVYADDAASATTVVTNHFWQMTGLAPSSTHTFRLAYVLADGRRSPLSPPSDPKTTYGTLTWGGIPFDWMRAQSWGEDMFAWPAPNADVDGDGASTLDEFLAGTDPTDPASVLRVRLVHTRQGMLLKWPSKQGLIYQVQTATNFGDWRPVGLPYLALGTVSEVNVGSGNAGYFRVIRLR